MFNLLNDRISYSIVYTALLEVITVAWFYGVNKFISNIGIFTRLTIHIFLNSMDGCFVCLLGQNKFLTSQSL